MASGATGSAVWLAVARPISVGSSRSPRVLPGISNTAMGGLLRSPDTVPNCYHQAPGCAYFMAEFSDPRFSRDC
ncbi:uncharacterized protein SCHCODRAFT_02622299 [Schizophyllum commune H4-8]|uniref:uncharacterized protein n=1 Tax=Schizophyllum commune (strain H4-8 / FGSC 9210) TaxID=578458 RepID=UPI00215E5790|nr:uncharacterized protein SCHCODRAFT_02622299 [Schizophyllum commune H4-8]KAI5893620.1 hypothetical protein SCHCODRAFT_02622299 [Schizophyllum commune H4-8]